MTDRDSRVREPERLVNDRELGTLLSRANAAYRAGLDETGAFQRLSERQEASERGWRWQGLTFGAVLSVAAGLVLVLGVFDEAPNQVAVGPEVSAGRRAMRAGGEPLSGEGASSGRDAALVAKRLSAESAKRSETDLEAEAVASIDGRPQPTLRDGEALPDTEALSDTEALRDTRRASETLRGSDDAAIQRSARAVQSSRERRAEPNADRARAEKQIVDVPQLALPDSRPANGDAPAQDGERANGLGRDSNGSIETRLDCSGMLKKDARAAEHCYSQRAAESSGLSAEMALYELARVRRDVWRDAKGALTALNDYRERFPQGSLRNEVGLSRVEILSELGRSREALTEAEALLGSAKGGERAAELYMLRGGIYRRDLADFGRAAQEYSKAEAFGGAVGAEATRLRGLSLEALGDVEGALAAYHRYLSGPDQPRKSEVHRRVEALTANLRGKAP